MKNIRIKVEQNGGEYYGYVNIKSIGDKVELINGHTVKIDEIEITFDEYITLESIKEIEDNEWIWWEI